jgi:hypothetical protein
LCLRAALARGVPLNVFNQAMDEFQSVWAGVDSAIASDAMGVTFGPDQAAALKKLFTFVQKAVVDSLFLAAAMGKDLVPGGVNTASGGTRRGAGRPPNNAGNEPIYFGNVPAACFTAKNGLNSSELVWANINSLPQANRDSLAAWKAFLQLGLDEGRFDNQPLACSWTQLPDATVTRQLHASIMSTSC